MADVQRIDKVTPTKAVAGCRPELILHYREGHERSEMPVTIEDVENGHVVFSDADGEENFDIVGNITYIKLSASNLKLANDWFTTNSQLGGNLPTQKV